MTLYSIGHSNARGAVLLALLKHHGITTLVDVRSQPYSRFNPQFRRETLKALVEAEGLGYRFLGDWLGGKPADQSLWLPNGRVDYAKLAASEPFQAGLAQLVALSEAGTTAFMCAEADFKHCHRYWLITRALWQQGRAVKHILHSGRLAETEPRDFVETQPSLF